MITIVDYGLGNLFSIRNMLNRLGVRSQISSDLSVIEKSAKLILPGVGSFDNGMRSIEESGLVDILNKKALIEKTPVLGICLGMQLFFERSEEGRRAGLGWLKGYVARFDFKNSSKLKIPHMGWNIVKCSKSAPMVKGFLDEMRFYFVHSYYAQCAETNEVLLTCDYGFPFTAAVQSGNIIGVQFHPEKSHKFGMMVLKNFAEIQDA